VRIAVNVSPIQLFDGQFARAVLDIVDGRRGRIALELTERVLMNERGRGKRQLKALSEAGLPLVLDDFGTGFSSLNHLRHFPISEVKIDRTFTADIIDDPADAQIVRGLIRLCADLAIAATAEGIETPTQLAWLQVAGCAFGQGYLMARPLPLAEAAALGRQLHGPRLTATGVGEAEPPAAAAAFDTRGELRQAIEMS
jgi:EAL domain-containing protein (putative c-di-GMP-specific phosphodiesterase class I)